MTFNHSIRMHRIPYCVAFLLTKKIWSLYCNISVYIRYLFLPRLFNILYNYELYVIWNIKFHTYGFISACKYIQTAYEFVGRGYCTHSDINKIVGLMKMMNSFGSNRIVLRCTVWFSLKFAATGLIDNRMVQDPNRQFGISWTDVDEISWRHISPSIYFIYNI